MSGQCEGPFQAGDEALKTEDIEHAGEVVAKRHHATTFLRIGIANVAESTSRVAVIAMMVAALSQKTAARKKARAIRQE